MSAAAVVKPLAAMDASTATENGATDDAGARETGNENGISGNGGSAGGCGCAPEPEPEPEPGAGAATDDSSDAEEDLTSFSSGVGSE
jgi:hypothetical protein